MNKNALVIYILESFANEWGFAANKEKNQFVVYNKETMIILGRGNKLVNAVLNAKKMIEEDITNKVQNKKTLIADNQKDLMIKNFFR